MTPEQLAELECHLAAGTSLPVAMTAIADPKPARSKQSYGAAIFAAIVFAWVMWLLK